MLHSFLKAIGFRNIHNNKELYSILEEVVKKPDHEVITTDGHGNGFGSFSKEYGENFGITVCGDFLEKNEFHIEYYFPYFRGSTVTTYDQIEVDRFAQKEAFAGICDDMRFGATLMFYVSNAGDILEARIKYENQFDAKSVVLSGLASNGKILLPVLKTEQQVKARAESAQERISLMAEAREGNQEAIDHLTMNDMDTYSMLSRRLSENKEDILSIVETSFIPYGIECDQYIVIGEITDCNRTHNRMTGESVWQLSLICNDVDFAIVINERDLYGEPAVGRRFRGKILLQGYIHMTQDGSAAV
jgi:hypothetical protein